MCTSRPTDFAATLGLFVLVPSVRVRVVFVSRAFSSWKVHFHFLCIYPRRLWLCALRFPFTRTLDSSKASVASVALHSRSETDHHDVTCTAR